MESLNRPTLGRLEVDRRVHMGVEVKAILISILVPTFVRFLRWDEPVQPEQELPDAVVV